MNTKLTKNTYVLCMINAQGATEVTERIASKSAVRDQIRTWDAKSMRARIWTSDGQTIFDGPALSFK